MTAHIKKHTGAIALLAGLALAVLTGIPSAQASESVDMTHPAFASVDNKSASVPVGHAEFCQTHGGECGPNLDFVRSAELTEKRWQQLLDVNNRFNTSIVPVTDEKLYQVDEYWTYPSGYGDCEDFVLAKRRALIQLGWHPSTLLISVVRERNGEGHAVLMVRTDRGDLVLDNQESLIKRWNDTAYRFIKRQSQFNSAKWVDIFDDRANIVTAATN